MSFNGISPPSDFNKFFNSVQTVIIVSSVLGAIVTILIVIAVIKFLQKAKMPQINVSPSRQTLPPLTTSSGPPPHFAVSQSDSWETINRIMQGMVPERPTRFSPQQLEHFTKNYSTKLGSGGFGVVYKGQVSNGMYVAVKVLNMSLDKRVEQQFVAEIGIIGRTHHINLVRLYGFCFDASLKALVYEYLENGSLDNYLFDEMHKTKIEWGKLHEIAIGTAKGLAYLHEECQQRITHYDIKPGNVLLDANFCPKVADFGLARLYDRENTHITPTGMRGTPGYAAPELYMPFPITYKCDVYSFGILLFEILGRRKSHDTRFTESQDWLPSWAWEKFHGGEMEAMMATCRIEEKEREKAKRMCKVALWCVQYLPGDRPQMSSVVKMLEGDMEIMDPTNPFHHLASAPTVTPQLSDNSMGTMAEEGDESMTIQKDDTPIMRKYGIGMARSS